MKNIKIILLTFTLALVAASFTGCIKPYDKPELVTIEASQTAFLVPLVGDEVTHWMPLPKYQEESK